MIVIYFVLVIVSLLFYILYKGVISLVIFLFTLGLGLFITAVNHYVRSKVTAAIKIENKRCGIRDEIPFKVTIDNPTSFPVLSCELVVACSVSSNGNEERIRFNMPIFPKNSQTVRTAFMSEHFGVAAARIDKIKIYDILRLRGLKVKKKNIQNDSDTALILPTPTELQNAVSDYSDLGIDSGKYSDKRSGDDPSEIFALREYADGDKPSKIHWKLTAKEDKLMVKDYSLPLSDSFLIVCDTYVKDSTEQLSALLYDSVISLSVSLSSLLNLNEKRHRIAVWHEMSLNKELQNKLEIFSVTDTETYIEACMGLVTTGRSSRPDMALKYILSDSDLSKRYGHIIVVCTELNHEVINKLTSSNLSVRYTILLCQNKEQFENGTEYSQLSPDAVIIKVRSDSIENSISELVL